MREILTFNYRLIYIYYFKFHYKLIILFLKLIKIKN